MEVVRRAVRRSLLYHSSEILARARFSSEPPKESKVKPSVEDAAKKERFPRIGDDGTAVTLTGVVKPKDDPIFKAIGTTDELCSVIGLARTFATEKDHSYNERLKRIQTLLIDISVAISSSAHPSPNTSPVSPIIAPPPLSTKGTSFSKRHVIDLEEWIDEYKSNLPPVEHFIIPGGGQACATLHLALSVCRRAERTVLPLVRDGSLDKEAQIYLNRLAEFLFIISRVAARQDEEPESVYTPKPNP